MKTRELIEALLKLDPDGNARVMTWRDGDGEPSPEDICADDLVRETVGPDNWPTKMDEPVPAIFIV